MYQIYPLETRPDPALIQRFTDFGVAMIADSMGRYGAMKPYITPITSGVKLAGPALTVQTYRSDNLMIHAALEMAKAGDVLVVDSGEVTNAGLWGGLMTQMALQKGLGGLVTDGGVRDKAEIIASGFPVYSKSISPLGGFKDNSGSVNISISCGGVVVNPGDIIIGDDDGVAVIPARQAADILAACEKTKAKEDQISGRIQEGETLFSILELPQQLEKLGLKLPE